MRNEDDSTPISESGSISQSESDVSSRIDPSTLFWQKSDIILVVDDNREWTGDSSVTGRRLIGHLQPTCAGTSSRSLTHTVRSSKPGTGSKLSRQPRGDSLTSSSRTT